MKLYLAAACNPSNPHGLFSGSGLPHTCASSDTLTNILTIAFTIIGAMAFLFMVIAGLRYVTSQGDPAKISSAKNQIIYSAVGLIIAASAVLIVNFILGSTK